MEKKPAKRKGVASKKVALPSSSAGKRTTDPHARGSQQSTNTGETLVATGVDTSTGRAANTSRSSLPEGQRHTQETVVQNGVLSRTLTAVACVAVVAFLLCQVSGQHTVTPQNCCTPVIAKGLSKDARALAAQIAFTPLEQPITIRRLLVGDAVDVAGFVKDVVDALPGAHVVTLSATDPRGIIRALETVKIDACCTIMWVPTGHLLESDGAGALKSLVETGGVGGRQYLSSRTALVVGVPSAKASDHLPDRWKQLFTHVEVPAKR
mmetsp:Transcript_7579/g.23645  ORF Transcript_7579/g.23645 Transcript_7579/m.23645 type:complete len:266 (+) Transcript_7579:1249-2046(+)